MNRIHIFRPGTWTDVHGRQISFSEAELSRTAAAYDPALHEAPLVVGHPEMDAPAYGWVARLEAGDGLEAVPHQVDPAFAELVEAGRYKHISASFYLPDGAGNPAPGVYYLRHVGFLGAAAPAVKGLRPIEMSEDADVITVEFGEQRDVTSAGLFRRLRDWIIERFGRDEADATLPTYLVETLEAPDTNPEPTAFAEADADEEEPMPGIEEREAELAKREAKIIEREKRVAQDEAERRRANFAAWTDGQVESGRLLPMERDRVVELLVALPSQPAAAFAEGAEGEPLAAATALQALIEAVPPRVDYTERAAAAEHEDAVMPPVPPGYSLDPAGLEIHRRALAYAAAHETDYLTAVQAVVR